MVAMAIGEAMGGRRGLWEREVIEGRINLLKKEKTI